MNTKSAQIAGLTNEAKVGFLVGGAAVVLLIFAWLMGAHNPLRNTIDFYVTYHFAGGIEVGSPVRVAGIKVGKVEKIQFFPQDKSESDSVNTPLKIKVSIAKEAADGVRQDSDFFINMAGIIGERYVEITPGTAGAPKVKQGDVLVGIDPPRVDQLISQSFNLAGKVQEILKRNEADISKTLKMLLDLSSNVNKTLVQVERSKLLQSNVTDLINNLVQITNDVKIVTAKSGTPEGKKTLELLHKLLWRLEPLNEQAIQKFFQKEGIKTKIF